MELLRIISGPLVGGIVGYVTNFLAIKMLFRPAKPVMIGKFQVPFTPGIVPRNKDRLAAVLGNAVVARFFNADDLEEVFLSDYFKNAVANSIVEQLYNQNAPLGTLCQDARLQTESGPLIDKIKDELCVQILAAILRSDLSRIIAEEGGRIVKTKFADSALGKLLSDDLIAIIAEPLSEQIEKYVINNGRSIVWPLLDEELSQLAKVPVSELISGIVPDKKVLYEVVCNIYTHFMQVRVRSIVETIDIRKQITDKVLLMAPIEVEELVVSVVKRELSLVVFFGFIVGVLIGTINIFI